MAHRPPLRVPDPSATIPDFGPRPDKAELAKIARAKAAQDIRDGIAPRPRQAAPAKKGLHPAVIALLGLVVAVVFGGIGFIVAIGAGVMFWLVFASL